MKLKKVSNPDSDDDLASDLNNHKNDDKTKTSIGVSNADKFKRTVRKSKSTNNDTNVHEHTKHTSNHVTNGAAATSKHNSDVVPNNSNLNSTQTNGGNTDNCKTTVNKQSNSKNTTVTLLAQSIKRLKSNIEAQTDSYKDNDDLDDSSSGSLLIENSAARHNGTSYNSSYLDPFKDDKDGSSSSCSSPMQGLGEFEDDSEDMVLTFSGDEGGTFATSPIPTGASVDILFNKLNQVKGDLCKTGDAHLLETVQENTNNPSPGPHDSNPVENTNYCTEVGEFNNESKVSTVGIQSNPVENTNNCTEVGEFNNESKASTVGIQSNPVENTNNCTEVDELNSESKVSTAGIHSNPVENTNNVTEVDELNNESKVSSVGTESSTDICQVHSDNNFDDLLNNMSSKEIELTKKKNEGVTVSDLRKEMEDFLNTENSISSEGNEKPVRNTEVSTENVAESVIIANDETVSTNKSHQNSIDQLQITDTDISYSQKEDDGDAKKNDEVSSDIESASGSTIIISSVSSDTDPTLNDDADHDADSLSDKVESTDGKLSSEELIPTFVVDHARKLMESEILVVPEEKNSNDKQLKVEQNTSEMEDSDKSIKILTISETKDSSGLDKTATNSDGLKSKETLGDVDKKEIIEENGDKIAHCTVVLNDTKIDDVEENSEETNFRSSLKRALEKSDDDIELKKQKILGTSIENEQPIKIKEECNPEKTELTEVQISKAAEISEKIVKRIMVKQLEDAKRLKLEIPSSAKNLEYFSQFMITKGVQRLSRVDLEEFTAQKMCESFNQHSKVAELLREIRMKDRAFEALRAKYTNLSKQMTDLDIVQTRISKEMSKVKDPREVIPVKITRSVGLQVSLQPLKTKPNLPAPIPHVPDPLVPIPVSSPLKKKPQRTTMTTNRIPLLPPPPPALTPAPSHVRPPPVPTGKGIKTILPKISSNGQIRDESNSLLGNILQKSPTTNNNATTTALRKPSGDSVKVIDLTDEDDSNRASTSAGTQSASGNIRVVAPHQLTNPCPDTVSPLVTTNMPRLTYLVQSPGGQQGQSVLLATTNAPTRPGQARPTLMFKPVVPQGGQKLNLVRPAVPGTVAVLPTTLGTTGVCKYVTTTYAPGTLTRSPSLTTRAIAPAPRHPAPLPGPPAVQASQPSWKLLPPKPSLKITLVGDGIVLSWRILNKDMSLYEEIASYQLYAYQETNAPPSTDMWRKVGDVKALALPMACTLTQFTDGNKYHFAVRGVDGKTRVGPFSTPEQIILPAQ